MFVSLLPSLSQVIVLAFGGLIVAAAISDAQSFTIPNRFCLAIALLYPAYLTSLPHEIDWISALGIAGGLLVVGFVLFARGYIGGGDAKLVAAVSLWAGTEYWAGFLILTGLAGGIVILFLWARHRFSQAATPGLFLYAEVDPNFAKQPFPYAIPIAVGGLYVAFTLIGLV